MFKILQKFKSRFLYGVAFSLVLLLTSFINGFFFSKNSPKVSKGVQLTSIPHASADVVGDTRDSEDAGEDGCDSGDTDCDSDSGSDED